MTGWIKEELTRHEQAGLEYRLVGNYVAVGNNDYKIMIDQIQIYDEASGWVPVEEAIEWH